MIELKNITKKYLQKEVVNVPHLHIGKSETVGLLGSNGSGKTTLLKIIVNLILPTDGEVYWQGEGISTNESWRKMVGTYLDDDGLINFLTPEEYFSLTANLRGMGKGRLNDFYASMDDFFAGEVLDSGKYINDFSKGNRQKIGVAGALLTNPDVLILDEPFSHLDAHAQQFLQHVLQQRAMNGNQVTVITSHDRSMISSICQRVVAMESGRVVSDTKTLSHDRISFATSK